MRKLTPEHEPGVTQHVGIRMKASVQISLVQAFSLQDILYKFYRETKGPGFRHTDTDLVPNALIPAKLYFYKIGLNPFICGYLGSSNKQKDLGRSGECCGHIGTLLQCQVCYSELTRGHPMVKFNNLPTAGRKPQKTMLRCGRVIFPKQITIQQFMPSSA